MSFFLELVLDPPLNLTVEMKSFISVLFKWIAPPRSHEDVTGYKVQLLFAVNFPWQQYKGRHWEYTNNEHVFTSPISSFTRKKLWSQVSPILWRMRLYSSLPPSPTFNGWNRVVSLYFSVLLLEFPRPSKLLSYTPTLAKFNLPPKCTMNNNFVFCRAQRNT